jgi:predicted Rossmann fold flavoprotein
VDAYDVIVLGAGAAGMFCAAFAGQTGKRVLVIEHAVRPGNKILISGGGRCNFTNLHTRPQNFLSQNPHFAKSALARYAPQDFISLVEKHGIAYHEKTLGQLFCDGPARQIVTMLESECADASVDFLLSTNILSIIHDLPHLGFQVNVDSPQGGPRQLTARAIVVATGGLSIPKMGATSLGYDIARQFDLQLIECRPALVPLVLNEKDSDNYCDLSGIATDAIVQCNKQTFRERLLITHRGISGPAILQASSYWKPGDAVEIDIAPGLDLTAAMRANPSNRDATTLEAALRRVFPQRLAERWVNVHMPADGTNRSLLAFEDSLHRWQVIPAGTEGYARAEVTAGGVDTSELSARTMESHKVRGLYFIGEVVDVTGHLGGFNFQWAWASAAAAGRAISNAS